MSQGEFAALIQCDRSYLSQLENGKVPISKAFQERIELLELEQTYPAHKPNNMTLHEPTTPYGTVGVKPAVKIRMIPVVSWARAGNAGNFSDLAEQIDEWIESSCADPNAFALILEGDSMEPKYEAGDRVVFAPNSEPRNGDFVVARREEDGGVVFKRFKRTGAEGQTIRLESLNPNYKSIEAVESDFRFIYPSVEMKRFTHR